MRRALVGAVSVITFVGMGTVVSASIPAADNVFHGCVNAATGLVRVIDPAKSGDLGHCRTTGIQALRETEISWNQQGVPGTPGTPGAAGDQGPVGPQGPKGDTGAQGEKGADGANGDSGEPGPKGDTGAQGPQGPAGTSTGVPAAHTEVIGYLDLDIHAGPLSDVPIRGITLPAPTQGPSGKNDDLAGEMDLALVPDAYSIGLMAQIADSRVARQGTLRLTDAQGTPYAEIKLSDVLITGLSLDTGDAAGQTLVLNYAGFELRTGGPLNGIPGAPAGSVGSVALETAAPTSISALSWSVTATVGSSGGGGRPVGRPTFAPITIDLPLGADAWNLLTRHALHRTGPSGRADLAEVTVVHPLSTGSETFTLENVNVDAANITITGTAGSVPTMSTVLSYSKLTRSNGTAEACWDESGKPSC